MSPPPNASAITGTPSGPTSTASFAYAEVPSWVKSNAGWWADGTISESDFLSGIEFLNRAKLFNQTSF